MFRLKGISSALHFYIAVYVICPCDLCHVQMIELCCVETVFGMISDLAAVPCVLIPDPSALDGGVACDVPEA